MKERQKLQKEALEILSQCQGYSNLLVSFFEKHLGKSVLEVGSGIGNITRLLVKKERIVVPSDIDKQSLEKLSLQFGNALFLDIAKNPPQNLAQKFDSVVMLNVLEHIKNDLQALENVLKLLKPGGKLILLVPSHMCLYSDYDCKVGHQRRYNLREVQEKLRKVGFKIIKINYFNKLGALGWFYNFKVRKRTYFPKPFIFSMNAVSGLTQLIDKVIAFPFGLSVICIAEKVRQ
ncbi:class I SAM-dependent methyltransferase [Candidatus Microgenomates bacterium]|jgi:SAM-dependent methyltransferase|nr:MAG: class I SAM-dependent methyltransferase [Candidatus Microgenomates bacterium]